MERLQWVQSLKMINLFSLDPLFSCGLSSFRSAHSFSQWFDSHQTSASGTQLDRLCILLMALTLILADKIARWTPFLCIYYLLFIKDLGKTCHSWLILNTTSRCTGSEFRFQLCHTDWHRRRTHAEITTTKLIIQGFQVCIITYDVLDRNDFEDFFYIIIEATKPNLNLS